MNLALFSILIGTTLIAVLIIFPFYQYGHIRPTDEGYYANAAWLTYKGKHPYKDFYLGYTPAKIYFLAWLFSLFGPKLSVARLYYCTVSVILTIMIVLISYLLVPLPLLAFMMGILFLISLYPRIDTYYCLPVENGMFSDRTVWALAFMACLITGNRLGNSYWYLISGILLILTTIWGQEAGIWAFVAGTIYILFNRETQGINLLYMFAGGLIPFSIAVYYILTHDISIKTVWKECFLELFRPKHFQYKRDYPSLFSCLPEMWNLKGIINFYRIRFKYFIHYTRYYWPGFIYLIALFFLLPKVWNSQGANSSSDYAVVLPLCYGIFSVIFSYSHPDYSHVIRGFPAQLPVTAYVLNQIYGYIFLNHQKWDFIYYCVSIFLAYSSLLIVCIMFYDLCYAVKTFLHEWNKKDGTFFPDKNGGCLMERGKVEELSGIRDFLQSHSNFSENILVVPADALLYFFNKRESPVYMKNFFALKLDYYHKRSCQELEDKPVKWIIYNRAQDKPDFFPKGTTFREFAPVLYKYIMTHYKIYTHIGNYDIYKRRAISDA